MEKNFYSITYWYFLPAPRASETHVFYGTLEDLKTLVFRMMEVSPNKIDFVSVNGLEKEYTDYISRPIGLEWIGKKK